MKPSTKQLTFAAFAAAIALSAGGCVACEGSQSVYGPPPVERHVESEEPRAVYGPPESVDSSSPEGSSGSSAQDNAENESAPNAPSENAD